MGYTSFSNSGHFEGAPADIWKAFADPALANEYAEHKTTFVPSPGFMLAAGNTWEEHHGEECDFDQVAWTITEHAPQSVMEYRGKQRGVHQRVQLAMDPEASGYRLTETIRFAPTVAGKLGPSMLSWLLLFTGILAKFANDKGGSLELLQDYLNEDHNGPADDSAVDASIEAKNARACHRLCGRIHRCWISHHSR